MKIEVENLKACLTERDSRIDRLELELFIVKDHCETDYQLLRRKYEDCKLELELLKENEMKLEKNYEYLRKELVRHKNKITKQQETKEIQGEHCPTASTNKGPGGARSYANVVQSPVDAQAQLSVICDSDSDVNNKSSEKHNTEESQSNSCDRNMSVDRPNEDIVCDEIVCSSTELSKQNQVDKGLQIAKKNNHSNQETEPEVGPQSGFIAVERKNTKRIYLGGVKEGVDVEGIKQYINIKGVNPSVVRLLTSKRKGTVAVKINVLSKDFGIVLKKEFWPTNVYVRPWYSVNKWSEKLKEKEKELNDK